MMAMKTSAPVTPRSRSNFLPEGTISPERRENMIREAAYFRYVSNPVPGHELDDWLAAEAELFGGRPSGGNRPSQPRPLSPGCKRAAPTASGRTMR